MDVQLIRTLTGGIWNTLCLPFDVTKATLEQAFDEGQDIAMRTFSHYDAENKELNFTDATNTTISAGTPFLVWVKTTVVNPTFHFVTVKNTAAQAVGNNGVSFVGTYSPVALTTDGTNLFITKTNALSAPAAGKNTMNGLRAYFSIPSEASAARIVFADSDSGDATSVVAQRFSTDSPVPLAAVRYDLSGRRVSGTDGASTPRRGLYIDSGRLVFAK